MNFKLEIKKMKLLIFVFLAVVQVFEINCHARLMVPPARSSAWREDPTKYPPNYTDNEMSCGGVGIQWNQNGLYLLKSYPCLSHFYSSIKKKVVNVESVARNIQK